MALNSLGIGFVFTAQDLATGVIERVKSSFLSMEDRTESATKAFKSNFAQFGRGIAVLGAGLATLGGVFQVAEAAGKFEQALAGVAAVSGATTEELKQLHDAAIDAGIKTQFSPTQSVEGLRELTQAGFSAKESIALLIPTLDLAAGSLGELTPQSAAGLVAQTMKAFGIETKDAALAVDQALQAVNVFALSAGELPLALGVASRGAGALNQSLSETLVALGLVKNVIPTVERASTATAVAMERLADPKAQARLRSLGVAVVDTTGRFRPFLDIIGDAIPTLEKMTEAQRSAFLQQTFGHEALAGVNAIMRQLTDGVRTNTGETVRGAAAVAYLRDQFKNAAGTAASFRDKLLDTYEGQKVLLRGSIETLQIAVGESFVKVLKPVVSGIIQVVNAVLGVIQKTPEPIKRGIAQVALALGVLLTTFGGLVAAKAAVALVGLALSALGVTISGIVTAMLPAVAIFAALGLVVAAFREAFKRDLGGIATFATQTWERISVLFRSLGQLFEEGGFSGAVRDELNKAENAGIKQFAIRVYQIVFRIQRFFEGIAQGFGEAIERARPYLEAFVGALKELGEALGGISVASTLAGEHSDRFAEAGGTIGDTLGQIASVMIRILTAATEVVTGIVGGMKSAFQALKPVFDFAGQAFGFLGEELRGLIGDFSDTGAAGQENVSLWKSIGAAVGWLAGLLASVLAGALGVVALALRTVVSIVRGVIDLFVTLGTWIGEAAGWLYLLFAERLPKWLGQAKEAFKAFFRPVVELVDALVDSVKSALDRLLSFIGGLAAKIPARFRPAYLDDVIAAGQSADVRIQERAARQSLVERFGEAGAPATGAAVAVPLAGSRGGLVAEPALPAVSQVETQSRLSDAEIDALVARGIAQSEERPIQAHVSLVVDGETLARASATANRNVRARSFLPVTEAE